MNREELQQDFHNEQGINWLNSQEEPDIDYVMWLENKILAIKNNTPLPPAEGAKTCWNCGIDLRHAPDGVTAHHCSCGATNPGERQPQPTAEGAEHLQKQIKQLKEFHTAFNLPQRQVPTIMPSPEFFLRHKILMEEVEELREAYNEGDIVEVADAITDCLYVLFGTALQFGIADKLEACFDEVHRSNMSKLGNDGKPIMREDGKVMKGENFKRPDLKRVLNEPVAAQPQPTAEGADPKKVQWSGYGELGNISQKPLQPTAEGAEEILRKPKYNSLKNLTLICEAMEEFATLHAQRIAEKMVEDKLRDELVMFGSYFNNLDPKDHILVKDIDEYLKSKEQ